MADLYSEIRPYRDAEVSAVVDALLSDNEFIDTLMALRGNKVAQWLPGVARLFARRFLRKQLVGVDTVEAFQGLVKPRLDKVVASTSVFTSDGIEQLSAESSYLFISNHRDIVMDSAYANIVLVEQGHRTAQIAIGDNLLQKPWVSHLMRINKSFIVKRNLSGPKQQLAASKELASFMRSAIEENRGSLWIAHREGRAKDGNDRTEAAVLKMLTLSRDKPLESPDDVLGKLNIVPITISYELDPCDVRKAQELAVGDNYQKRQFEDLESIAAGITDEKGRVHLQFGTPLTQDTLSVAAAVEAIDKQMVENYRLFQTNIWAYEALGGDNMTQCPDVPTATISHAQFMARFDGLTPLERNLALSAYAKPVFNWLHHLAKS
ncbi:glycerol acyltransferase [Candidatus Paraluminiphilus aquimaris]|uniref:Glycerol acyltransferase n=1 Tax=Candidatus Paraluminiphilus aquimaris TaxID=2518994 RepID=A0ABY6Q4I3_9GAMM|nr:1-acyl-sn-glycerol-3-phosphate acyltransferase [Candidatus Paraluminiphilus aquimaris]UZP73348.1 glycerol acyltransferase [Candidatus Paraluminiphilus aquimaris]